MRSSSSAFVCLCLIFLWACCGFGNSNVIRQDFVVHAKGNEFPVFEHERERGEIEPKSIGYTEIRHYELTFPENLQRQQALATYLASLFFSPNYDTVVEGEADNGNNYDFDYQDESQIPSDSVDVDFDFEDPDYYTTDYDFYIPYSSTYDLL